jgi:coproporphyrinogen III oxidase
MVTGFNALLLFEEDAIHFHQTCKPLVINISRFYPKYKKQCDAYFWNAHRNEARGLGGLFFDYCKETEQMSMNWFNFVTVNSLTAYVPVVEKKNLPTTNKEPGKKSEEVVMSLIWFTTKALYLA